jgi:hypothetical protein
MYAVDGRHPDGSAYKTFILLNFVQRSQLPDGLAKSLFAPMADDPLRNLGVEKLSFFSKRVFGRILQADTGKQPLRPQRAGPPGRRPIQGALGALS